MSVLQRGDRLSSANSRGSVGRWVFADVERDLIGLFAGGGEILR